MERKSVKSFYLYFFFFYQFGKSDFFGTLGGICCFSTCYDGAPLRSPVLEKGVMLGVLPKQPYWYMH